jgi:hypothetical protein
MSSTTTGEPDAVQHREQGHDDAGHRCHQIHQRDEGAAQPGRRILGDEHRGRDPDRYGDEQREQRGEDAQRQDRRDAELVRADEPGGPGEETESGRTQRAGRPEDQEHQDQPGVSGVTPCR